MHIPEKDITMERISIEIFFTSESDLETNQYKILGGIRKVCSDFTKKKIYPSLAALIELKQSIDKIKDERNNLNNKFPKQIKGFDINAQKIIYESAGDVNQNNSIEELFNLIDWALPYIEEELMKGLFFLILWIRTFRLIKLVFCRCIKMRGILW